jgi:hypothetical protein
MLRYIICKFFIYTFKWKFMTDEDIKAMEQKKRNAMEWNERKEDLI